MNKKQKSLINITAEQNIPGNLRLLAAQRLLYSEAKQFRHWRLIGSIGLAVIAPILLFYQPTTATALTAFGTIWLAIDRLLLKRVETQKVKQAAIIQEEFDTELFKLSWNRMLVGNKVSPEQIGIAVHRYKGNYDQLRDWYPDTGSIPYPLNVLICQRINLAWDWQLRRRYAIGIATLTAVYILLLIGFAIATNRLVIDFLLGLLFPALSAVIEGVDVAWDHFHIAHEKEEMANEILSLWEQGLKNPHAISKNQCRDIQDCIYTQRSNGPLVPDWWYNRLRNKYEVDMYATARKLIDQAAEIVRQ